MRQTSTTRKEGNIGDTPSPQNVGAQKKRFPIWILLVILLPLLFLGLIGGGIYYYLHKHKTAAAPVKGLTLPAHCPKNMPLYPKAKILSYTCKDEASSIESVINVDQKKVKAWYLAEVPKYGWTIRGEDSASYLFDNETEIGKVSLSTEKKNTVIKFLTAKRTAAPPTQSRSSTQNSSEPSADISESLFNWDDYFNSIESDYTAPTDEGVETEYTEPPIEDEYTEEPLPPEPTEEITEEPTPEITEEPTEEPTEAPTPGCWFDDKGGYHCR